MQGLPRDIYAKTHFLWPHLGRDKHESLISPAAAAYPRIKGCVTTECDNVLRELIPTIDQSINRGHVGVHGHDGAAQGGGEAPQEPPKEEVNYISREFPPLCLCPPFYGSQKRTRRNLATEES